MHLINETLIEEGKKKHADAREWLSNWAHEVKTGKWRDPDEVRKKFRVSILPNNGVVFKVKGKRYRLVVRVDYRKGIVVILFFGTHAEYDKFNAVKALK